MAHEAGTKTATEKSQTKQGIKDKFQQHFLRHIFDSYKSKRKKETKQAALKAKFATLPPLEEYTKMINLVWRLSGELQAITFIEMQY
jgi:hypothetical protein